jgi:anti-sigma28 factor (negative regulator of flagellin synthesis)
MERNQAVKSIRRPPVRNPARGPKTRSKKLAKLREKILSGRYKVTNAQLAKALFMAW